jgi:hypothetical protein
MMEDRVSVDNSLNEVYNSNNKRPVPLVCRALVLFTSR